MKKPIIILILAACCLAITASAGARIGQPGYAVRDDNTIKEIQAIKVSLRSMESEIRELQLRQPAPDITKYEARLIALEKQVAELSNWILIFAILIVILVINVAILDASKIFKKKE